ncbi:hypothetical protein C8R44DRAFT_880242 [Mycena epipterygia]|nr:hypothetical protein C8R44DRAFT_880242 [Mycena epipterygia]
MPCKFFLQGSCRNGNDCSFIHDTVEAPTNSSSESSRDVPSDERPSDVPPESPLASETHTLIVQDQTEDIAVSSDSDHGQAPVHNAEALPCSSPSASAISAATAVFEPCTFHSTGRCLRGDACVVHHSEPVGPLYSPIPSVSPLIADLEGDDGGWMQFSEDAIARASNYDASASALFDSGSYPPITRQILRPCKYFAVGTCATGDACPYIHDIRAQNAAFYTPVLTVADSDSFKLGPCRYYSQGRCRKGSKCCFRHDTDEPTGKDSTARPPSPSPEFEASEEQATNWLLDTDDNPYSYGGAESNWLQTTDENAEWMTITHPDSTASDQGWGNGGAGWIQETDENPEWATDPQGASKWTTDATRDRRGSDAPIDVPRFPSPAKDVGAESSWDTPWPDAIPDVKPSRKPYCKYFGQGHCLKGDECKFLHVRESASPHSDGDVVEQDADSSQQHPDQQDVPSPPLELDLPPQSVYHCTVRFGSGAIPEQVVTPFESHGLILSHYPAGMTHADLLQLAEPYGVVKNTTFRLSPTGVQAYIEFEEHSQAAEARVDLNGATLDELVIEAHLDSVGSVGGCVHELKAERQLKLIWDAPSVSGWAFYPNVGAAKEESTRLNGMMYGDRKIVAEYRKPSQKHSIPVSLSGLPLYVNREALHKFCPGSSSVSLNAPNYVQSPDENILACLAEFGPVKSFDVLPTDPSQLKITGFVEFYTGGAAASALQGLKGRPYDFLGKKCITVQPVFHSKYPCADSRFAVIRDDLDRLRDSCSDSACTIRYYQQPPRVHIYGRRAEAMAPATKSVQALLFGSELACWDPYFETPSSEEALKRINTDASFYIRSDKRRQVLRIWGNRDKGEKQISRLLKQVHAKRHSLHLEKDVMPALLSGGLKSLHDSFGTSKILLDLRSQTITVLGDIKTEVVDRLKILASAHTSGTGNCCLCFSDAVEPVELACTHIYCSGCLKLLLRPIPGIAFTTPRCIAEVEGPDDPTSQCLTDIPISVILAHLSDEEQTQLFESSLLSFARAESDFRFCVSGCPVLYRVGIPGEVFTCPECSLELCASCAGPVHIGLTCAEDHDLPDVGGCVLE